MASGLKVEFLALLLVVSTFNHVIAAGVTTSPAPEPSNLSPDSYAEEPFMTPNPVHYAESPVTPPSAQFPIASRLESMSLVMPPSASVYPSSSAPMPTPSPSAKGIKGAYWPSFNKFPASAIDTSYFTHILYAFLSLKSTNFELNITQDDENKIQGFMSALRAKNPPVKTLLSIGGGDSNSTAFSKMVSSNISRAVFIRSTIDVARRYGFDGLDLDWEFPANEEEMSNLGLLLKEWYTMLNQEAIIIGQPRLLLTAAVYYSSTFVVYGKHRSYPSESIRDYLDWINPMCYDFHGKWDNFTGFNAALYDPSSNISTSYGIQSWIEAGVPAKKLVMGLPLYAKTWTLANPFVNGLGAPAVGVGPGDGILIYPQVVQFNNQYNATVKYDTERVSKYSYAGSSWIGYDDAETTKVKIEFARSRGLGGYFFWAIGQDKNWTISRQASDTWDN